MNSDSRVTLGWPAVAAAVIALLAVGAGTTYLLMQTFSGSDQRMQDTAGRQARRRRRTPQSGAGATVRPDAPLPDVVVTLSEEAMKRAGIETGAGDERRRRLVGGADPRHGRTECLQAGRRDAARRRAASRACSSNSATRCGAVRRCCRSSARSWRTPRRSTCPQRPNSRRTSRSSLEPRSSSRLARPVSRRWSACMPSMPRSWRACRASDRASCCSGCRHRAIDALSPGKESRVHDGYSGADRRRRHRARRQRRSERRHGDEGVHGRRSLVGLGRRCALRA